MDLWSPPLGWTLMTVGQILLVTVILLLTVAFLIYADRKIWAGVQMRKGPNVVGPFGLFQSFADFLKFVLKEITIPSGADKVVFLLAPLISFILAFGAWAVIPFAPTWVVSDINVGILYAVPAVHDRRVLEHRPDVRPDHRPLLRRLATGLPHGLDGRLADDRGQPVLPGCLRGEGGLLVLHGVDGQGDRAPLPLRPAD